ncbi:MAG: PilX N-terminal domain-containing pilus assembly protein [Pseudomonadota bacterium]
MSRNVHAQRGAAALIVTVMLLLAMALAVALANRDLLFEQRSASNGVRAAQAFEAAEAGLDWATAQLNANRPIGADCAPSAEVAATSFRSRYLAIATGTGLVTPRAATADDATATLRAACVRTGDAWSCSCPTQGAPTLPALGGAAVASFVVAFEPGAVPGVVGIAATGCIGASTACLGAGGARADATATVHALLGLIGGLRTPPAATLTTGGEVDAGTAAIGLANADPRTGLAVAAGGAIIAPQARLAVPPGAAVAESLVDHDASLSALDAPRHFAALFGLDRATWQLQAAVHHVDCRVDCRDALVAALAASADAALIHVDGDLALAGPLTLGSAARPALIVVGGDVRLDGAIALTGLLHAAGTMQWNGAAGGSVRGALVPHAGYRGDAAPDLTYDVDVLDLLRHRTGSFARVPGSWRDH